MDSLPTISVVIPMRNEARFIADCLRAVLAQDYPSDLVEVLVVDGESEDDSRAIVEKYAAETGRVRLLRNPHRIVPCALNIGIRAARGEVIARVDGHTVIAPDYLRNGIETLRRTRADNVGGPMVPRGGGAFGDAVAAAMSSRFGIGAYFHFGTEEREVDTVYLGMWPRHVFAKVGLFDEELLRNQDDEFNYRLRKFGGRIVMTPRMRSSYQNRATLRGLLRQFYQYGLWKVRVCQKHPMQMSWRHFVPPALVLNLLSAPLAGWAVPPLAAWTAVLAGSYAAAVLAASALVARRGKIRHPAYLPVAFAAMHLAWGTGFLIGLCRFAHRWLGPETAPPRLSSEREAA